jgi:membrane protein DedA with SNARE-associated domain
VDLARVVAWLTDVIAHTGPYAPAVLLGASFLEYVFPPFPGDVLVLLGAWYAVQGLLSWPATLAAVTAGALLGAIVDWRVGRAIGPRLEARAAARGRDAGLARFEASYRRWGPWFLVVNRFLPGGRALIFVAAGACRVPLRQVIVFGGISAVLWNALLLGMGALVAKNADDLVGIFQSYTRAAWIVVGLVAAAVVARALWRRRPGRVTE